MVCSGNGMSTGWFSEKLVLVRRKRETSTLMGPSSLHLMRGIPAHALGKATCADENPSRTLPSPKASLQGAATQNNTLSSAQSSFDKWSCDRGGRPAQSGEYWEVTWPGFWVQPLSCDLRPCYHTAHLERGIQHSFLSALQVYLKDDVGNYTRSSIWKLQTLPTKYRNLLKGLAGVFFENWFHNCSRACKANCIPASSNGVGLVRDHVIATDCRSDVISLVGWVHMC